MIAFNQEQTITEQVSAQAEFEVPNTSTMAKTIAELTKAHPTAQYAVSVLRPSLALAQGHAMSLLQGIKIAIKEWRLEHNSDNFGLTMNNLFNTITKMGEEAGFVVSAEIGLESANGFEKCPSTYRWLMRDESKVHLIMMFSDSVLVLHTLDEAGEAAHAISTLISNTLADMMPRPMGYIHTVMMTQEGIRESSVENKVTDHIDDTCYPFIKVTANDGKTVGASELMDMYLQSNAAVLNMIGSAGTGKSMLAAKVAKRATDRHTILVDNAIFYADAGAASALITHIRGLCNNGKRPLVILEEVDQYIRTKEDNNIFLQQLLSLTSGVIAADLKVMTLTNLKGDTALADPLKRTGRSFANINFRPHTTEEAKVCATVNNRNPEAFNDKDKYILADIMTDSVISVGGHGIKTGFQV